MMSPAFQIEKTAAFDRWLGGLRDRKAKIVIARRIGRMEIGNFGDVRPVGRGVSELRVDVGPGYRIYFTRRGSTLIILLCGGDKSSQSKDIKSAISIKDSLGTWKGEAP